MKSPFNGMSDEELMKKLAELRMQAMKLNSALASKAGGKSVGQLHKLKRSIAQAETALSMLRKNAALKQLQLQKKNKEGPQQG